VTPFGNLRDRSFWVPRDLGDGTFTIRMSDTRNRATPFSWLAVENEALAAAAEARGWFVHWYDRERVLADAAAALGRKDVEAFLSALGRSIGPPWRATHKLAAAAALAATRARSVDGGRLLR